MEYEEFWVSPKTLSLLDFRWKSDRARSGALAKALGAPLKSVQKVDHAILSILAGVEERQAAELRSIREPEYDDDILARGIFVDNDFPFTRSLDAVGKLYAAFRLCKLERIASTCLFGPLTWIWFNEEERVLQKVLKGTRPTPSQYAAGLQYVLQAKFGPLAFVTDIRSRWLYELGTDDLWSKMSAPDRVECLGSMLGVLPSISLQHGMMSLRIPLGRVGRDEEAVLDPLKRIRFEDQQGVHLLFHRLLSLPLANSGIRWDDFSVKRALLLLLDGVPGGLRTRAALAHLEVVRASGDLKAVKNVLAWITLEPAVARYVYAPTGGSPSTCGVRLQKKAAALLERVRRFDP